MNNPANLIEAIKTLLTAALTWVVVMGYWPMDATQQATTLTFGIAFINTVGAFLQSRQTTPLSNPKAADGEPLVRASSLPVSSSHHTDYRGS